MAPVAIPTIGLELTDYPSSTSDPKKSNAPKGIEIYLQAPYTWKDIIGDVESSKSVSVSLGKKPVGPLQASLVSICPNAQHRSS